MGEKPPPIPGERSHPPAPGDHLRALVESELDGLVEFLFALEDESGPAFALCQQIQQEYPEREIQIVISGSATGSNARAG